MDDARRPDMDRIGVILNPHSRKNRLQKRSPASFRSLLGDRGLCIETHGIDAIRPALRDLLDWGATVLVADGGDGALGWVLNELLALEEAGELPRGKMPPLLPSSSGRVNFVARKARLSRSPTRNLRALVKLVEAGETIPTVELDSLLVEGETSTGEPLRHVGFAIAAGGVGQRFFDKFYRLRDPSAGKIAWVVGLAVGSYVTSRLPLEALRTLGRYGDELFTPTSARVVIDGRELEDRVHGALHAGAFDLQLGPFHVFPLAHERGAIHFQAGAIVPSEIVRALPALCLGRQIPSERLVERRGQEMRIEGLGNEALGPVIDGEIFHGLSKLTVRRGPNVRIATPLSS